MSISTCSNVILRASLIRLLFHYSESEILKEKKAKQLKRHLGDNVRFKSFCDLTIHSKIHFVPTLEVVKIILVSKGRNDVRLSTYPAQH